MKIETALKRDIIPYSNAGIPVNLTLNLYTILAQNGRFGVMEHTGRSSVLRE